MKKSLTIFILLLLFISCMYLVYQIVKNEDNPFSNPMNKQEQIGDKNIQNNKNIEKNISNSSENHEKDETQDNNRKIELKNVGYIEQAIINGDTGSLKYLLDEEHTDVNKIVVDELGYSLLPFSLSVEKPSAEIVKILIDKGADVNVSTKNNGLTPLHIICQRDDIADPIDIVRLLLQSGADVNKTDAKGRYIIVQAVIKGHPETTRQLIKAGADINVTNSQGYPLLKIAIMQKLNTKDEKYEKIVQILKNAGAK